MVGAGATLRARVELEACSAELEECEWVTVRFPESRLVRAYVADDILCVISTATHLSVGMD